MRNSLVPLLTAAAIAFGFAFGGSTTAKAESVMAACASQWKATEAAGTTGGQTWPQFLAQCRTRQTSTAAPPSGSFAPRLPRPLRLPRPRSQAPCSRGGSSPRLRLPRRRRTSARPRPRGLANTRPNWRRAPAARPTRSCGSTRRRASTTTRGPTIMGIPSGAPTCARPTRERLEIARRERSFRPSLIRDKGRRTQTRALVIGKEKPRQRGVALSGA